MKQALSWKAECSRQAGDPQAALEEFWVCLTSDPGPSVLSTALQGFSESLRSVSNVETAQEFVEKARGTPGLDVTIVASVELDYAQMLLAQDPGKALIILDEVRHRSPPEPFAGEVSLLMGEAFAARSEWQRAIDILAALSDTRADEVGARATGARALALEASGDLREAISQYLRIAYLFPSYADLAAEGMYNAARLAVQLGDKENAERIEEGLRARYPTSEWVSRLQELK
jgi:tetratricopeptide (TPR) repeat protein